jgi:hypothetical protein
MEEPLAGWVSRVLPAPHDAFRSDGHYQVGSLKAAWQERKQSVTTRRAAELLIVSKKTEQ